MTVYLVGAGPGDPGLLTLRAAEVLGSCDVVMHDRLVSEEILAMAPLWAERIDVGKSPGGGTTQEQIHQLLIDRGRRYDCVVRLKGGDPHVFGRAAEEVVALAEAGVNAVVVPGISSALAAPTAAGVPLTSRHASSGFTVVTAHQDPANERTLDWDAIARLGTTLVILMGAAHARSIAVRLISGGMSPATPVAVVTNATRPDQADMRTVLGELGVEPISNPATIIVGAVAAIDLRNVIAFQHQEVVSR